MEPAEIGGPMNGQMRESMYRIVKTVASPLRFFAVAALVLAAIIIVLAWKSALPPDVTLVLIVVAFTVLVGLIGVVTVLVVWHPKKLVFDQEAHLTVLRERLGDSELPALYVPGTVPSVEPPKEIGTVD